MGHPDFPYFLGDVTIRNPSAKRYQPGAARVPGYAAIRAADEKRRRYPTKRGVGMVPLVQETYGRLGEEAEHTHTRLAMAHSRRNRRKGLPPGNVLNSMRVRLDGALHPFTGFMIASARLGPPGIAALPAPSVPLPRVLNCSWPEPGQGPDATWPLARPRGMAGPSNEGRDHCPDLTDQPVPRDPIWGFPQYQNLACQVPQQINADTATQMHTLPTNIRPNLNVVKRGDSPDIPPQCLQLRRRYGI